MLVSRRQVDRVFDVRLYLESPGATGEAYELTHDRKLHSSPNWSPDGKWIVYTADDNWQSIQLEILNVATGEARPLTRDNQVYVDPVFSPDGDRLAYVSTESTGNLDVIVRPMHNGDWSGQACSTQDHRNGKPRPYFSDFDLHIQPAWLKDGKGFLLVSNRSVPLGSGKLWRASSQHDAMASARVILDEQSLFGYGRMFHPKGSEWSTHRAPERRTSMTISTCCR